MHGHATMHDHPHKILGKEMNDRVEMHGLPCIFVFLLLIHIHDRVKSAQLAGTLQPFELQLVILRICTTICTIDFLHSWLLHFSANSLNAKHRSLLISKSLIINFLKLELKYSIIREINMNKIIMSKEKQIQSNSSLN